MRLSAVLMSSLAVAALWAVSASGRHAAMISGIETTAVPPGSLVDAQGMADASTGIRTAGALTFGPPGVLLVGDSLSASVFAFDVGTGNPPTGAARIGLREVDRQLAALLGTSPDQIVINDLAVQQPSEDVYFSLTRGRGSDASPALVRLRQGRLQVVPIDRARHARLELKDGPPAGAKTSWGADMAPLTITDLAFIDGQVYVAGLSREAFASTLRISPFPFTGRLSGTSVEIFHTSHNRYETNAPIETLVPVSVGGTPSLLTAYGCAPIALFTRSQLQGGARVRGRTVAELGGGNRPLDMIAIERNGAAVVIVANSDRTLMRIRVEDLASAPAITSAVTGIYESAGTPYVSIPQVGVVQLDNLNAGQVIVVQRDIATGTLNLNSLDKRGL